ARNVVVRRSAHLHRRDVPRDVAVLVMSRKHQPERHCGNARGGKRAVRGAHTDHMDPSMLDLLRLRRLANQALDEPFAAAPRGNHDRLGREDDLLATVRRTDSDGLDPLAVPMWGGVSAEDPVVVTVAQCLDKTTL